MIKKIVVIGALSVVLASCSDNINVAPQENLVSGKTEQVQKVQTQKEVSNLKTVGVSEFKKELEKGDGVLIDLRTNGEVSEGVIPGAVQIDFYAPDFQNKINSLDRNKKYLIYCRSGARSGRTLGLMKSLGFKNVVNLDGGIGAWINSGEKLVVLGDNNQKTSNSTSNNEEKVITLNAKKWEYDKKEIRVKKGEKLKIKVNNLDTLHGIAIPDMKLVGDNEIEVDTSKTGTFEFRCANYCGEGHQDMTGKLIIE